jgi:hypothetical protein
VVRFGSISKIEKFKLRIKSEKTCFHLHERVGIESLSVFLFTCTCALRGVFSVPGVSSKQNPQAKEFGVGEGSGMRMASIQQRSFLVGVKVDGGVVFITQRKESPSPRASSPGS